MALGTENVGNVPQIAIVTPSYERDFDLCVLLNRSVLAFAAENVRHYIIVPHRDLNIFRAVTSERTVVLSQEEIAPRGFVQLPHLSRWWYSTASAIPVKGWLMQQIVKIGSATALIEPILVILDSDAVFVREVNATWFLREGKVRLYRSPSGITVDHAWHINWHRTACRLLGIAPASPPMDDYIGSLISWDRQLVLEMCAHVETITGLPWHVAVVRASAKQRFSEYLLYGLFVDRVLGASRGVWVDDRPGGGCHTYWDIGRPLGGSAAEMFAQGMGADDVALMISSQSGTSYGVRQAIVDRASASALGHSD
jgi:hypothetical protein